MSLGRRGCGAESLLTAWVENNNRGSYRTADGPTRKDPCAKWGLPGFYSFSIGFNATAREAGDTITCATFEPRL